MLVLVGSLLGGNCVVVAETVSFGARGNGIRTSTRISLSQIDIVGTAVGIVVAHGTPIVVAPGGYGKTYLRM